MSFDVNVNGYRNYADTLRQAQRRLNWASAYYLTELAWKDRDEQQRVIESTSVIRNRRFVKSHLVVDKAQGRQPIDAQIARAGSRASQRFTGWEEQQEGGEKPRIATRGARVGNSRQGRMSGRARLKPGNKFLTQNSQPIKARDEAHRVFIFLRMMSRRKKEPFVLTDNPMLPTGLWTLTGRHGKKKWPKPQMLQAFGANEPVKRTKWASKAQATIVRRANTRALWERCWTKANVTPRRKTFK